MLNNILANFNWFDVVLVIVIIRAVYIGALQGFVIDFFKLLGMFFATVLTLHYYSRLGEFLQKSISLSIEWSEVIIFVLLWALIVLIFKFIREGWLLIIKAEAKGGVSQWGGGFIGVFRSFLICGMLFLLCGITGNKTLNTYAENCVGGRYLRDLSPKVYQTVYDGVLVKFFPEEKLNERALGTEKEKSKKK